MRKRSSSPTLAVWPLSHFSCTRTAFISEWLHSFLLFFFLWIKLIWSVLREQVMISESRCYVFMLFFPPSFTLVPSGYIIFEERQKSLQPASKQPYVLVCFSLWWTVPFSKHIAYQAGISSVPSLCLFPATKKETYRNLWIKQHNIHWNQHKHGMLCLSLGMKMPQGHTQQSKCWLVVSVINKHCCGAATRMLLPANLQFYMHLHA